MISARFFAGREPSDLEGPLSLRLEPQGGGARLVEPGTYEGYSSSDEVLVRIRFEEPEKKDHDDYLAHWRSFATEAPTLVSTAEVEFFDEGVITEVSDALTETFGESILEVNGYPLWLGAQPDLDDLLSDEALAADDWADRVRYVFATIRHRPWAAAEAKGQSLVDVLSSPEAQRRDEWPALVEEFIDLTPGYGEEFEFLYDEEFDEEEALDAGFAVNYADQYNVLLEDAATVLGDASAIAHPSWPDLVEHLIDAYAGRPLDPAPLAEKVLLNEEAATHDAWQDLIDEFVDTFPEEAEEYADHELLHDRA